MNSDIDCAYSVTLVLYMLRYKHNQCYSMYVTLQAQSVLLYMLRYKHNQCYSMYVTLQAQSVLLYMLR
jgi:hypothetical protein